jgi:hypothetical protein
VWQHSWAVVGHAPTSDQWRRLHDIIDANCAQPAVVVEVGRSVYALTLALCVQLYATDAHGDAQWAAMVKALGLYCSSMFI